MVSVGLIKLRCEACNKIITGKYIHFSDGSIFCKECYDSLPKCSGCKKPIIGGKDAAINDLCPSCYRRAPKCDICNKPIIGSYTRFVDRTIACDDCMQKYQKCDRCGKPVVKYTKIRGQILCKYCLKNAPRCSVCNNPITQTYWVINEQKVCNYCYKIYERCDLCGLPRQVLFTVHDKKICYDCQKKAQICSSCGLPIIGNFYQYKNKEGIYCEHCEKNSPHCFICDRPVGVNHLALPDGRKICLDCQVNLIETKTDLRKLVEITKKGFKALDFDINDDIHYRLVSKSFIDNKIADASTETITGKNYGLFIRKNKKMVIYLLSYLPYSIALGTISHELGHSWLSENVLLPLQSKKYIEGFCEWISYKILKHFNYHQQAEFILDRDDAYGEILQRILSIEKENGIEGIKEWITSKRKMTIQNK
jgi:hypothetical protein